MSFKWDSSCISPFQFCFKRNARYRKHQNWFRARITLFKGRHRHHISPRHFNSRCRTLCFSSPSFLVMRLVICQSHCDFVRHISRKIFQEERSNKRKTCERQTGIIYTPVTTLVIILHYRQNSTRCSTHLKASVQLHFNAVAATSRTF